MKPRAVILINERAKGGRGREIWTSVEPKLAVNFQLTVLPLEVGWESKLLTEAQKGGRIFFAAGGDGTVHSLVNFLAYGQSVPLKEFTIGAIALGSSNDFHKPVHKKGIPLRTDFNSRSLRDIGIAKFVQEGKSIERAFVVSSSIGLVAEANSLFNSPEKFLRILKKHFTDGAILYAALKTIATFRSFHAEIQVNEETISSQLIGFHALKTPFLSGSFEFNTPVDRNDGNLRFNLLQNLTRAGILRALLDLSRKKFLPAQDAKRKTWLSKSAIVSARQEFSLELDGEIYHTQRVEFSLLPAQIWECGVN